MTIPESNDRRNREGLGRLRQRFVRRARTVSESDDLREWSRHFRDQWNRSAPRYQIVPVASVDELFTSTQIHKSPVSFSPANLLDDLFIPRLLKPTFQDWERNVANGCARFWPSHYFPDVPASTSTYPVSFQFLSACVFCSPLEVGREADRFFPEFRIEPRAFPYKPGYIDKWTISRLEGQVEFLLEFVRNRLGESISQAEREGLMETTFDAGWEHARREGIDSGWDRKPSEYWWHIPLFPGVNTTDLREAEGRIVDTMRGVFGERRIDQMVIELRDGKMSIQKIAGLLGVSKDQVLQALRDRPEGS